jgi:hypothetical protein
VISMATQRSKTLALAGRARGVETNLPQRPCKLRDVKMTKRSRDLDENKRSDIENEAKTNPYEPGTKPERSGLKTRIDNRPAPL